MIAAIPMPFEGFIFFIAVVALLLGGTLFLLRKTIAVLLNEMTEHAGAYALVYAKGAGLITIAMIASFEQTWLTITSAEFIAMPWWVILIMYSKPLAAGLAVFIAFIDRSASNLPDSKPPTP